MWVGSLSIAEMIIIFQYFIFVVSMVQQMEFLGLNDHINKQLSIMIAECRCNFQRVI